MQRISRTFCDKTLMIQIKCALTIAIIGQSIDNNIVIGNYACFVQKALVVLTEIIEEAFCLLDQSLQINRCDVL